MAAWDNDPVVAPWEQDELVAASPAGKLQHQLQLGASALARGVAKGAAFPLHAGLGFGQALSENVAGAGMSPTPDVMGPISRRGEQPYGSQEELANAALEGAGMAAVPFAGAAPMVHGGIAGLLSNLVAQREGAGGVLAPAVGLASSIITPTLASLGRGSAPTVARTALGRDSSGRGGVSDEVLRQLADEQRMAQQAGLSTNIAQHEPSSPLYTVAQELAQSPEGVRTRAVLQGQPQQLATAGKAGIESLIPGTAWPDKQALANRAAESLSGLFKKKLGEASAKFVEHYDPAERLKPAAVRNLDAKLAALEVRYKGRPMEDMLADVRDTIQPSEKVWITDPKELNDRVEEALSGLGKRMMNTTNEKAVELRQAQEVRQMVRGVLDEGSPQLRKAMRAYSEYRTKNVEPLQQRVGAFTGQTGYLPTKNASATALPRALFQDALPPEPGRPSGSVSPTITLGRILNEADPTLFRDLFRTHIREGLTDAVEGHSQARGLGTVGPKMNQVLGEGSQDFGPLDAREFTRRNQMIRDSLAVVAEGQGLTPQQRDELIRGVGKFQRLFQISSNVPGIQSQPIAEHTQNISPVQPAAAAASGLYASAIGGGSTIARRFWWSRGLKAVDEMMNDPNKVHDLIKLGGTGRWTPELRDFLSGVLGTGAGLSLTVPPKDGGDTNSNTDRK